MPKPRSLFTIYNGQVNTGNNVTHVLYYYANETIVYIELGIALIFNNSRE